MNKKVILISLAIILLAIIAVYLLIPKTIDKDKVLNSIKPEIEQYCNVLNTQAVSSNCPTCRINLYNNTDVFSNSLDIAEYIVSQEENGYKIDMRIPTIYGYNTRMGEAKISFKLDKNYNILSKNLTLISCM